VVRWPSWKHFFTDLGYSIDCFESTGQQTSKTHKKFIFCPKNKISNCSLHSSCLSSYKIFYFFSKMWRWQTSHSTCHRLVYLICSKKSLWGLTITINYFVRKWTYYKILSIGLKGLVMFFVLIGTSGTEIKEHLQLPSIQILRILNKCIWIEFHYFMLWNSLQKNKVP